MPSLGLTTRDGASLTVDNADLEAYDVSVFLAPDGMTPNAEQHNAVITGVIERATWTALRNTLEQFGNRMNSVVLIHGVTTLVQLSASESVDRGPYVKMSATEVVGTTLMLARFEVSMQRPYCQERPLLSHVWRQSTSVDENGQMTRTIEGHLQAFGGLSGGTLQIANQTNWSSTTAYVDLFRAVIVPDVPGAGWRRQSQSFAIEPSGTALNYTVVDKQHLHDLPNGVAWGDMEFSYERSAEQAGVANCSFSAELTTSPTAVPAGGQIGEANRLLVAAAVALSKSRINANLGNTIITRMRITERNLLHGASIRFELDSQIFPSNSATAQVLTPLAYMIGQAFRVTRNVANWPRAKGPYGTATVSYSGNPPTAAKSWYANVPHYVNNFLNGMEDCDNTDPIPTAALFTLTESATEDATPEITIQTSTVGVAQMNADFNGKYAANVYQPPNSGDNYTEIVAHSVSLTNAKYTSGVVRLSPMYVTAADCLFQTQKPYATVRERIEVARANVAPSKAIRPLPTGAFVIDEDWNVTFGKFDPQGNRVFIGVYERTYGMYDDGDSGRGFATQTTDAAGNIRAWGAPNQTLLPTLAKVATTASQVTTASVFSSTGSISADQKYSTGAAETFIT